MSHKLSNFRKLRSGREVAFCATCEKEVGVVHRPTMGGKNVRAKCESSIRMRVQAERKAAQTKERNRREREEKRKKKEAARMRVHNRKEEARAKKKQVRQTIEDAAKLWRQIVYTRANNCCEFCGRECEPGVFEDNALHAHHVIKRSQSKRLQLDPANGQALCKGHHQYADRDMGWSLALLEEKRPGSVAYLLKERRISGRKPFDVEMEVLRVEAERLGIAV